jgi:dihydrofolate reductase
MSEIVLVAAIAENSAIGKDNDLLWHLPEDLKHFKETTLGHTVVMGRKTFDSLGKPLPRRENWVVSRNENWQRPGVRSFTSLKEALDSCTDEVCMILGGAQIYQQALKLADRMELTHVHQSFDGDAFFPEFDESEWEITRQKKGNDEKSGLDYTFKTWVRKQP